jgi:hypothetical protein
MEVARGLLAVGHRLGFSCAHARRPLLKARRIAPSWPLTVQELGAASEAFDSNVVPDSDRAASGIAKQFSAIVDEQDWRR